MTVNEPGMAAPNLNKRSILFSSYQIDILLKRKLCKDYAVSGSCKNKFGESLLNQADLILLYSLAYPP